MIFKMIFLLLVLTVTATDSFDATYKLTELQTNNGWLYLTSFHFKPHLAKVQLKINVEGKAISSEPQHIIIQGVPTSEWEF